MWSREEGATSHMSVFLHGLGTALPPHELPQDVVKHLAEDILGSRYPQSERLQSTFASSGIERRYSVVPQEWFFKDHGWGDRNNAYLEGATALFIQAARRALATSGWAANEVDCIVTVLSTGIATPTLEARAMADVA